MAWEALRQVYESRVWDWNVNLKLNQHLTECIYTVTNNICFHCYLWLAADVHHVIYMVHT